MNIVQVSDDDVTGWKRYIKFNYNDVDYSVTLYWNENEGYDVTFKNMDMWSKPDWVDDYKSINLNGDENGLFALCFDLDELSYMFQNKVGA